MSAVSAPRLPSASYMARRSVVGEVLAQRKLCDGIFLFTREPRDRIVAVEFYGPVTPQMADAAERWAICHQHALWLNSRNEWKFSAATRRLSHGDTRQRTLHFEGDSIYALLCCCEPARQGYAQSMIDPDRWLAEWTPQRLAGQLDDTGYEPLGPVTVL